MNVICFLPIHLSICLSLPPFLASFLASLLLLMLPLFPTSCLPCLLDSSLPCLLASWQCRRLATALLCLLTASSPHFLTSLVLSPKIPTGPIFPGSMKVSFFLPQFVVLLLNPSVHLIYVCTL